MRVVITGANSAVGQAILRCGSKQDLAPYELVAAVRSERAAEEVRPLLGPASGVVRISYEDSATLDAAFAGASAVVHLAGILVERPGSTYEQANIAPTRGAVEAAKRNGLTKFVLVSAIGANETSSNRYWRTKGESERLLRNSGLCYTILRAPLLLGPGTEGSASLERNARRGKAKLIGGGRNFQQPLHVDDLARAALLAARPEVACNRTLDLVGPAALPDRELVERAGRLLGNQMRIRSVHKGFLSFAMAVRQRFAGPGFSPDAVEVIAADTNLDPQPAVRELGIELTGIDEMIKDSLEPSHR